MQTYVSKPELVEATQVKETDFTDDHPNNNHMARVRYIPSLRQAVINGPDGQQVALIGDWIVKNAHGDIRRVRHDQFVARYTITNESVLEAAMKEVVRLRMRIAELESKLETAPDSPRPAA